jgi:hypothetical protein
VFRGSHSILRNPFSSEARKEKFPRSEYDDPITYWVHNEKDNFRKAK